MIEDYHFKDPEALARRIQEPGDWKGAIQIGSGCMIKKETARTGLVSLRLATFGDLEGLMEIVDFTIDAMQNAEGEIIFDYQAQISMRSPITAFIFWRPLDE